ncbi:MAG: ABC transporter permease [Candidatus Bathyarchaeia archaeon]
MKASRILGLSRFSNESTSNVILGAPSLVFLFFIIIPLAAVFYNLDATKVILELQNPQVLDALSLGAVTASLASFLSFLFGVPTAYLLATRNFMGKSVVDAVLDVPMILPPAVAGLALLLAFAPRGLLGPELRQLGIILPGSTLAVVLSQFFVASPFILRSSKAAFENVDKKLVDSARLLNPSRLGVFLTVTLPLAANGVVAGFVMTWARAIGEFGATLMFAGNLPGVTQTMPLAIYMLMAEDPLASNVLSAILVATSFTLLIMFRLLSSRKKVRYHDQA